MEDSQQTAAATDLRRFSDDDDRKLFNRPIYHPDIASVIIRIKNNDPEAKHLGVYSKSIHWDESTWRRLGCIISQNTNLEVFEMFHCDMNTNWLGGLRHNRSIQTLRMFECPSPDDRHTFDMSSLVPILRDNPKLREICLNRCKIQPSDVKMLCDALSNRREYTLEDIDLSDNNFREVNLDGMVQCLMECKRLKYLNLTNNRIGARGCRSLARLLENQECNIEHLRLSGNEIDDKSAKILAESLSLAKNNKLKELDIGGNPGISTEGWSAMLKLVCDSSSSIAAVIKSNHTITRLGLIGSAEKERVTNALKVDNANLLWASLRENGKPLAVRRKVLWSHARGDLNIGVDPDITTGTMPRILAWLGNCSDLSTANLIQYHSPPLPKAKLDTIRLDSLYRILQTRSDLFIFNGDTNINDIVPEGKLIKRKILEIKQYCIKRPRKDECQ